MHGIVNSSIFDTHLKCTKSRNSSRHLRPGYPIPNWQTFDVVALSRPSPAHVASTVY
jgi:hypothetical protein